MPEQKRHRPVEYSSDPVGPRSLPYSAYPKAVDVAQHGLQSLPESLPLVDFERAKPYRSSRYSTVLAPELTKDQLLQMAWVIATGFARREPQARHLGPPKHPPAGLMEARHTDPFGTDPFGSWDTETQLYWVTRLTALTDPPRAPSRSTRRHLRNPSPSWMGRGASSVPRSTRRWGPSTWNPRCGRAIRSSTP